MPAAPVAPEPESPPAATMPTVTYTRHTAASRNQAGTDDDSGRTGSSSDNHFGNQRCPGGFRNDARCARCARTRKSAGRDDAGRGYTRHPAASRNQAGTNDTPPPQVQPEAPAAATPAAPTTSESTTTAHRSTINQTATTPAPAETQPRPRPRKRCLRPARKRLNPRRTQLPQPSRRPSLRHHSCRNPRPRRAQFLKVPRCPPR